MTELKTRDGKLVKEIGSWEKEYAKAHPLPDLIEKTRKRRGVKSKEHAFISRCENSKGREPHWCVRIRIDGRYYGYKVFYDSVYGSEPEALKAAIVYRDEYIKTHKIKIGESNASGKTIL